MLDLLARLSRPILIVAALLLIAGIVLTGLNLLVLGWSLYAIGHVGAIVGFVAVGAVYRRRIDGWSWLGLLVLIVGLVLALPQVASIWVTYYQPGAGREMELLVWTTPFGLTAELVTWVGAATFGLAARGASALPAGIGWVLVAAAIIGLLADLYVISPLAWVAAMLLVGLSLLGVGVQQTARATT